MNSSPLSQQNAAGSCLLLAMLTLPRLVRVLTLYPLSCVKLTEQDCFLASIHVHILPLKLGSFSCVLSCYLWVFETVCSLHANKTLVLLVVVVDGFLIRQHPFLVHHNP